jgi:hypothetical protein
LPEVRVIHGNLPTATPLIIQRDLPKITWEKLPDDFVLPDDPVDNNLQPLLAEALRESLELAGLFSESMLMATNLVFVPRSPIKRW